MYLSRLRLFGFKSFANKTNVDFHDGMTAIVGPNGCGKSNIVDGIRWVLGEQKAGALRSDNMQNVIFNGTRSHKPLGMAEVSLTILNNRNVLPIEYSEVVLTRRLFRSGESQYLINNAVCRLKDIVDLFTDTGMGANAYSVIELSMVERILNGRPEERRQIFEEAAGVTKYKTRRKAAFRKLEATEQDLIRLSDILSEVEKTVSGLKRQVNKARRYRELTERLRTLELDYSAFHLAKIENELEPLLAQSTHLVDEKERLSANLAKEEAEIEEEHVEILEIERKLHELREKLSTNRQKIHEKEEEILVSQERTKSAETGKARAQKDIQELTARQKAVVEEQEALREEAAVLEKQIAVSTAESQQAQDALNAFRETFSAKKAERQTAEQERLKQLETISECRKREESLRTQLRHYGNRSAAIEAEEKQASRRLQEAEDKISEFAPQKQNLKEELDDIEESQSVARRDIDLARRAVDDSKSRLLDLQGKINSRRDRISILTKFAESYEDYPEGVRFLLLENEKDAANRGILGDVVTVEERFRPAIEAALGDLAVALIVENGARAGEAIHALREARKGSVTFLPSSAFEIDENGNVETERPAGVLASAGDIVSAPEPHQKTLQKILRQTWIVETLPDAMRLAGEHRDSRSVFVTLDGDWVHASGVIRGGGTADADTSLVGRKATIEKLRKEWVGLQQRNAAENEAQKKHESLLRQRLIDEEDLQQKRKITMSNLQFIEVALGQAEVELKQFRERIQSVDEEKTLLRESLSEADDKIAALQPQIDALLQEKEIIGKKYAALQDELHDFENDLAKKEEQTQKRRLQHVSLQGERKNLEQTLERLRRTEAETQKSIRYREEEIVSATNQVEELTERIADVRDLLQADFRDRKKIESGLQEIEREHKTRKQEVEKQDKQLRGFRARRDEISDRLHKTELRISELKMNRQNIIEQMQESYETEVLRHAAPEEMDTQATSSQINEIKQKLRGMGPVNLLALKDHESENERLEFLLSQRDDLMLAEENLKETIRVINTTAQDRFDVMFSKVRENFVEVFKSFFENGVADLRLAGEDPLEADIEIDASPKGKKLGPLALLSGGEKTLTAISILFALYLVKPSPFCILDEVDAPLDDANIKRFSRALEKFSDKTQFIIVTHNKLTMNAARQLYGITMEEPGVSKVVSVKFDESNNTETAEKATNASVPAA